MLQLGTVGFLGILRQDQLDDFIGMLHGIAPPLQRGLEEGPYPFGVEAHHALAGEQVVAVEVDAVGARSELEGRNSKPLQGMRLVRAVGRNGVDLALDEFFDPEAVGQGNDMILAQPRAAQVGQELVGMGFEHDAPPLEVVHRLDVSITPGEQDKGGMLEDHPEHDDRRALLAGKQQGAGADAEIGMPFHHLPCRVGGRVRLDQADVQPHLAVEALLERGIVARELELVLPLQLEGDALEGLGRQCQPPAQEQDESDDSLQHV